MHRSPLAPPSVRVTIRPPVLPQKQQNLGVVRKHDLSLLVRPFKILSCFIRPRRETCFFSTPFGRSVQMRHAFSQSLEPM